jgi:hypothetical protein
MREIIYNIDNATAGRTVEVTGLTETLTANNVLGIINKTTKKVLYAPTVGALQSVTYSNGTLTIVLADTVTPITAGDKLFVKLYTDADGYALETSVKDGNDTAISVSKDIRSELGTVSDTPAETGTLFAVLKWIKNKVVSIYNAITDGTNGLAAIKTTAASAATDAAAAKDAAQALSPVALAADAYNTGKVELAANITAKGVEASASETLPQLAQKVTAIAQQPIILSPSEVGDMYAVQQIGSLTTPNYWNLYEVLNTLLNDGRLLNYGGILLAEYYRGYNSLELSGAGAGGAYVVSDMENGVFKMYTEDTTHVWSTEFDGRGNRWVAYCFAEAGHDFDITDTNTCPRSIHIGRSVGTIRSLVNGRISEIVCNDGNSFINFNSAAHTQNFQKRVILRNLVNQTSSLNLSANVEQVYVNAQTIQTSYSAPLFKRQDALNSIILHVDNFSGYLFEYGSSYFSGLRLLNIYCGSTDIRSSINVQREGQQPAAYNLLMLNIVGENLSFSDYPDRDGAYSSLSVFIGYISNDKRYSVDFTYYGRNGWKAVPYVEIQEGWCKPLGVSVFVALSEVTIYSGILQRLKQDEPDCGDGVTITLGSTNLAKLTSEESVQLLDDLTNIYGYTFA